MNFQKQFCNSNYAVEMDIAERELFAFLRAVTQQFGPEEAKLSAEDWLDEAELTDSPPLSTSRNWRAVTIAASARLANRLAVLQHCRSDRHLEQGKGCCQCRSLPTQAGQVSGELLPVDGATPARRWWRHDNSISFPVPGLSLLARWFKRTPGDERRLPGKGET